MSILCIPVRRLGRAARFLAVHVRSPHVNALHGRPTTSEVSYFKQCLQDQCSMEILARPLTLWTLARLRLQSSPHIQPTVYIYIFFNIYSGFQSSASKSATTARLRTVANLLAAVSAVKSVGMIMLSLWDPNEVTSSLWLLLSTGLLTLSVEHVFRS